MSRRPRLDYDFCPMPRRWHAAWAGSSLFETGLRDRLFELNDGEPIPFEGDWMDSLCKQAAVNGRERPPARKAMLEWQSRGLLIVNGQWVWICCRHDAQPRRPVAEPTHNGSTSNPQPTHNAPTSNIQLDSSTRNNSNHVGETDRQTEETERVRARAPARSVASRPDIVGFNFVASLLGRDVFSIAPLGSYRDEYHWIGTRPADERESVAKAVAADEWCTTNPGHVDAAHLQKGWQKYLNGRPKPVAKTTGFQQLAVAAGSAYREL